MAEGSGTRERIVAEAMRLFAAQGYEATTVSDIQSAVGLSPGSGGLYRHFVSKEAVLRAAVERRLATLERPRGTPGHQRVKDLRIALRSAARFVLALLAEEGELTRVILRDGDRFPELLAEVRERVTQSTHREFERWLREQADAGLLREHDARGVAAVAVSALVLFRVDEMVFGAPPGGVEEGRFVESWVELMMGLAEGEITRGRRPAAGREAPP